MKLSAELILSVVFVANTALATPAGDTGDLRGDVQSNSSSDDLSIADSLTTEIQRLIWEWKDVEAFVAAVRQQLAAGVRRTVEDVQLGGQKPHAAYVRFGSVAQTQP